MSEWDKEVELGARLLNIGEAQESWAIRERAWAFVERMANEPHDLSTPALPSNLASELLQTKVDLISAFAAKVQDFAQETRRASFLQRQLTREHDALTELWERYEQLRRDFNEGDPHAG